MTQSQLRLLQRIADGHDPIIGSAETHDAERLVELKLIRAFSVGWDEYGELTDAGRAALAAARKETP